MHILFSFLMITIGTLHTLFSMDVEPTAPNALTQQWLELAYDFHTKQSHFKPLPAEVQGIITAQVHPRQTIDELSSDHFMFVRQITIPHIIASWHMKDDAFVYFTQTARHDWSTFYDMYHLDLTYGVHTRILKNNAMIETEQIPSLVLSSHSVVFNAGYESLDVMNFTKSLKNPSVAKPWLLDAHIKGYQAFACHPTLPLCAIIDGDSRWKIYDLAKKKMLDSYDINDGMDTELVRNGIFENLQWHPTLPIVLATQSHSDGSTDVYNFKITEDGITGGCSYGLRGALCISLENKVWGGRGEPFGRILPLSGLLAINYSASTTKQPHYCSNRTLKAVGEDYYLTEDHTAEKPEGGNFSLHAIKTEKSQKLTCFTNYTKQFSRLPQNYDYRYLTIAVDGQHKKSTLSIAVPASQACIEHYCVFQAALSAEQAEEKLQDGCDSDDEREALNTWRLFAGAKYKNLILATAQHYPHFKKLMVAHKIMEA